MSSWNSAITTGLLSLPSGRIVRGRGLGEAPPNGEAPDFGVYLLDEPPKLSWPARWVDWPDFGLPTDPDDACSALREAWRRAPTERVEVAYWGGHGRTGTALACLAILDGLPPHLAVDYVRSKYRPAAIETPAQEDFIARLAAKTSR
ncbi:protein phosphatase [Arthrobacter agilis]|nr:protein phosphatase [Arthrobacter agilis]PPB47457.1 protein phosphatase [Arthrobacter agilis]TPV21766.1 protein phosphatase [Arthrobacter agilis]